MHYATLVIVEPSPDTDAAVAAVLADYKHTHWDWYQIGGRWAGAFDGYDPEVDPANIEPCPFCAGTGTRTDMTVANGCNRCQGKGKCVKWPTQWGRHKGDIIPVVNLTQEMLDKFYCVVSDWGCFREERYIPWAEQGGRLAPQEMPPLDWLKEEHKNCLAVVVDCHN